MKNIMLIALPFVVLGLQGCITPMLNYHGDYCNKYTEQERAAFRTLAGNMGSIDCSAYEEVKPTVEPIKE